MSLSRKDLERLSSWLRCYPIAGREDERKSLQLLVERELGLKFVGAGTPAGDPGAEGQWHE